MISRPRGFGMRSGFSPATPRSTEMSVHVLTSSPAVAADSCATGYRAAHSTNTTTHTTATRLIDRLRIGSRNNAVQDVAHLLRDRPGRKRFLNEVNAGGQHSLLTERIVH